MLTGVMIIASLGLLLYWFRYSCGLILRAQSAHDYTETVAEANELRFLDVQRDLPNACDRSQLDRLAKKLDDDYHLLSFLLRHSPAMSAGSDWLEQRMLMIHFELMKCYYTLASHISRSKGRGTLQEMARVVSHFANRMGERAAWTAAAL